MAFRDSLLVASAGLRQGGIILRRELTSVIFTAGSHICTASQMSSRVPCVLRDLHRSTQESKVAKSRIAAGLSAPPARLGSRTLMLLYLFTSLHSLRHTLYTGAVSADGCPGVPRVLLHLFCKCIDRLDRPEALDQTVNKNISRFLWIIRFKCFAALGSHSHL